MAVVAEPALDFIDDRLAARNAVILGRGAGAGRRQQHCHRGDHRHPRFDAGARSRAGDLADQRHGRGHVDGDDPGRHAGQGLWPALRRADRFGLRRAVRPDLMCGGAAWIVLAVAGRYILRRPLRGGASILPLCRHRYGEPAVPAQGRRLGAGRRHFRRRDRLAARHLHQGRVAALSVRRHVPGAVGLRGAGRDRAGAAQNSPAAGVAFADRRAAAQRNRRAAEIHRSRWSAAWPAIR